MPHRSYASTANYRFGFNGKENDNEPKGLGNEQDYGMRIYDPRLGKFLSVDPLTNDYPWNSSYAFAENSVICGIDLDGEEFVSRVANWLGDKAASNDMPRLGGFIRSFQSLDGGQRVINAGKAVLESIQKKDFRPVGREYFNNTAYGMWYNAYKLVKSSLKGDKDAQGQVIGIGVQIGISLGAARGTFIEKTTASGKVEATAEAGPTTAATKASTSANSKNTGASESNTANSQGASPDNLTYFRGAESINEPFKMSKADIKNSIDPLTNLMKEKGVSLNLDKNNFYIQKYGGAWEVDLSSIPSELKIIQTKGSHYEITPLRAGTMTLERYQELLNKIKVKSSNSNKQ